MENDLISRSALIKDLEGFKMSLGDIIFVWLLERVIDRVRQQPAVEEKKHG